MATDYGRLIVLIIHINFEPGAVVIDIAIGFTAHHADSHHHQQHQ